MKNILSAVLIIFGTSFVSHSQKYAYIDSEYILENVPEYKEAKEKLDKLAERWTREIEDRYADLKAKISSKSKYALTLVEALELDNLITGYFNTEFKTYMLKNPTKATQRLEDIKELKKETNRIINNHYDNVKSNYNYGYKPSSELELYIRNNCDIRNFRDYKSWKECAKEKLQAFE